MLSRVIISKAGEERGSWVFNAEQWLKKRPPLSLDYIMLMMIWQQIFYISNTTLHGAACARHSELKNRPEPLNFMAHSAHRKISAQNLYLFFIFPPASNERLMESASRE
jgi:hypothetical protein